MPAVTIAVVMMIENIVAPNESLATAPVAFLVAKEFGLFDIVSGCQGGKKEDHGICTGIGW